jgi:hypothetical protein
MMFSSLLSQSNTWNPSKFVQAFSAKERKEYSSASQHFKE